MRVLRAFLAPVCSGVLSGMLMSAGSVIAGIMSMRMVLAAVRVVSEGHALRGRDGRRALEGNRHGDQYGDQNAD